jgi:hypothetical protein
VAVEGDFEGDPATSTALGYHVEIRGDADAATLEQLVRVDGITAATG